MRQIILITILIMACSRLFSQDYETIVENFDDNSRGWDIVNSQDRTSKIEDGYYIIENKHFKYVFQFITSLTVDPNYDYWIETKLSQIGGYVDLGFGLLWGYEDWTDYNRLLISVNGYSFLESKLNDKDVIIPVWERQKRTINGFKKDNVLRVEKNQKGVKIYINGKEIYSEKSLKYVGTKLGFSLDPEQKVKIDYIKIYRRTSKLNLVNNPVNQYELENLGSSINSPNSDRAPVIAPDGQTLYYARNHPENFREENSDIWYSKKSNSGDWLTAKHLPKPINNSSRNFIISISPDGNTVLLGNTYNQDGTIKGEGPQTEFYFDYNNLHF